MSASHRPLIGGGGLYVNGGGDVVAPVNQEEKEMVGSWRPGYYPQEANWNRERAMDGAQNSTYPAYDPNLWPGNPQCTYPSNIHGCQRTQPNTNYSYGNPYPQAPLNPPYPSVHSSNQYYHPPPPQPPYSVDHYKSSCGAPPPPPQWGYPHNTSNNISRQPPYPVQDAVPSYPFHSTNTDLPQQTLPPQYPYHEGWPVYNGAHPYPWQTATSAPYNTPSCHYAPGDGANWSGGDIKDPSHTFSYNPQTPLQSCDSGTLQPGSADPKPPNPHYSSAPKIYKQKDSETDKTEISMKEKKSVTDDNHPGIVKIRHILDKVEDLEREVDEFVGMKTDMSYRCLEEMLTKELLELDSVDTGGQVSVRQARKEAVKKLQLILEKLERKGF
ncbi:BAG family molecular chaperone regulator 4 [Bombina bombina]|uniref:BAG family molecular chaperone regulator 4 n=1 Tax=Bombina bombina TaxID=8345 RepID=UPI00235A9110|nr:BAG family molecular chaperone regulator 4 [Bombina bombina]